MHHAVRVRVLERTGDLRADGRDLARRERAAGVQDVAEALAVDELHHEERAVRVLAPVVDRHHVRVVEARGRPGLAPEALARTLRLRRRQLHRHPAVEQHVARGEDLAHAAACPAAPRAGSGRRTRLPPKPPVEHSYRKGQMSARPRRRTARRKSDLSASGIRGITSHRTQISPLDQEDTDVRELGIRDQAGARRCRARSRPPEPGPCPSTRPRASCSATPPTRRRCSGSKSSG